jgi:hypothetical protein
VDLELVEVRLGELPERPRVTGPYGIQGRCQWFVFPDPGALSATNVPIGHVRVSQRSKTTTKEETVMNEHADAGLQVALAYHRAWTGGDFERAMAYVSPEISCRAPAGLVVGMEAFRGFMEPFARTLKNSRLLAAFGEGDTALLMYDTETVHVAEAPAAEWHTVSDGRIVSMRIIFDRLPFDLARRAASDG